MVGGILRISTAADPSGWVQAAHARYGAVHEEGEDDKRGDVNITMRYTGQHGAPDHANEGNDNTNIKQANEISRVHKFFSCLLVALQYRVIGPSGG